MEFKEKIQEIRKAKNLSQEKLAEKLNISRQAIAKWESGESYPDINNLILISKLFNISIDRLLKDDNCVKTILERDFIYDDIIDFLLLAKRNTYAGNGEEQKNNTRPQSHDLIYEEGKYKYIDTYLGGERFLGEEAIFENETPIWAMNYAGIEMNEKFSSSFLKLALSNVSREMPYRGPSIFKDGEYTYVCNVSGDFNWFQGKEEIYSESEKVYECIFNGGLVK